MRIIILGSGAIGGGIGGRLLQHRSIHGHDVVLVARGEHGDAIRQHGLTLADPDATVVVRPNVVADISELAVGPTDVVVVATKTHQVADALDSLRRVAVGEPLVVCALNGVESERVALRLFERVAGLCVLMPALMLDPGVIELACAPIGGVLDVGRYPAGIDDDVVALCAALEASQFSSKPDPNVMRAKYRKLVMNMGNAVEALTGSRFDDPAAKELVVGAMREAETVYAAAGIDVQPREDEEKRRTALSPIRLVGERERHGSTWQSLARGATKTEVDYLAGEIVLLGRLHGIPTPTNTALQRTLAEHAARSGGASALTSSELLALVRASTPQ